jgi:hypothetical protein
LSDVKDVEVIRDLFQAWYSDSDTGADWLYDSGYNAEKGQVIPVEGAPANWQFTVKDTNTETQYDSYGNGYLNDGYIVFEVTNGEETALYKLPMQYASYDGWDFQLRYIVPVQKVEKVISVWEWKEN